MSTKPTSAQTVLVVDDSPLELQMIRETLESRGYRVVVATDGDEAIERAAAESPSVVLLDVILPKKNGFQVCRHLKAASGPHGARVILVTSKSQETDRFWGMRQGADEYLTKPLDLTQLAASVERHMNPRSAQG
ncbi:MAG: response regulator [Acidobacteria bacterium]|nr:response regulator [Acidobacteriota bacterium]